jgi:imidazolonepropionase-like amidohydrolase
VPDEATAVRLVEEQKAAGYDFLKIHPGIKRGPFDALAATANRIGIGFSGHVPVDVTLERALEARYRSIDHLDGYVVPTQSLMPAFMGPEPTEALAARPEMKYVPKQMADQWVQARNDFLQEVADVPMEKRRRFEAVRAKIIKALDDADAGVLLGADTPQIMQVPGWATHGELKALVASGLTPYRALRAGTINVARFFGTAQRTGTIAVGKEASLVLVDGNPLEDIASMGKISGVMVRGRWLTAAEQDQMLAAANR